MLKYLLKRLGEPSTMAGASAVAQAVYAALYSGMPMSIAVPAAMAGMVAIISGERGE